MFVSHEKMDLLARYMVVTGKHIELRNLINYYEAELDRIIDEDTARGIDFSLQQDEPLYSMGD